MPHFPNGEQLKEISIARGNASLGDRPLHVLQVLSDPSVLSTACNGIQTAERGRLRSPLFCSLFDSAVNGASGGGRLKFRAAYGKFGGRGETEAGTAGTHPVRDNLAEASKDV
jgi:hypothetical protein